jgi:microcystin-dependent protein
MRIHIEISSASTKRILVVSAVWAVLAAAVVGHAVPNNFTRGQTLSADMLNANFKDIETRMSTLAGVPVGTTLPFAGATLPAGFLLCNGAAVSRTGDYAALFAAIGTAYGPGDDTTTFNVPDLRGRIAVGRDDMGGVAARRIGAASGFSTMRLGAAAGEETHLLTIAETPTHTHALTDPGHGHSADITKGDFGSSGTCMVKNAGCNGTYGVSVYSAPTGVTIASAGGGQRHNTVQPSLVTNYIIKY